jgi:hypothetical protein
MPIGARPGAGAEVVKQVPCGPWRIATWPLTALAMILGTKCGETAAGSSSSSLCALDARDAPMPVPMIGDARALSGSFEGSGRVARASSVRPAPS